MHSVLGVRREEKLEIPFKTRPLNSCLASIFWAQPGSVFGALTANWYGIYVSLCWEVERHEPEQAYGTTLFFDYCNNLS